MGSPTPNTKRINSDDLADNWKALDICITGCILDSGETVYIQPDQAIDIMRL